MFIKFILNKPYKHIIRGVKAMKKTNKEGIVQQSDILPYIDNKNKFYIIILVQRTCHGKIVENTIEERIQSIRKHKQGKSKCKIK